MSGDSTDRETHWTHIEVEWEIVDWELEFQIFLIVYEDFSFSLFLSLSASASACKYQYVSVYLCVIFIPFNMFFCVFFFFFFFFSLSFVWVISAGFVVEYVHWYATSGMCFCCVLAQLIGWMSEWASKYTFPCANHAFIVYTLISVFLFFCLLSLNRTISC